MTNFYSPQYDCGVAWDDLDIWIAWPAAGSAVLSDEDRKWPWLRDLAEVFA